MQFHRETAVASWLTVGRAGCVSQGLLGQQIWPFGWEQSYELMLEHLKHLHPSPIPETPDNIREKILQIAARLESTIQEAQDHVDQLRHRIEKLEKRMEGVMEAERKRLQLRDKLLKEVGMPKVRKRDPFQATKDTWGVPFTELQKLLEES